MDKGKRLDLIVLLVLLTSIVVISGLLVGFGNRLSPKKVASLAILYNAGLGANREDFLNNPSYTYDDRVVSVYEYFAGKSDSKPVLSSAIKMHNVDDTELFSTNPAVDRLISSKTPRENISLKNKLLSLIKSNKQLDSKGDEFKIKLGEAIYRAIMDFTGVKVNIIVGGKVKTLDLSKLDPSIVVSIMIVESSLNPYALMEEKSLNPSFSQYVYSRGLMQIYEITLWTLNSWLKESQINIKPEGLWSIRDNIFLGMVYLSYANEMLEE